MSPDASDWLCSLSCLKLVSSSIIPGMSRGDAAIDVSPDLSGFFRLLLTIETCRLLLSPAQVRQPLVVLVVLTNPQSREISVKTRCLNDKGLVGVRGRGKRSDLDVRIR